MDSFYIIFFVVAIVSTILYRLYNKKHKKLFIVLAILIPVLVSAFRNGVGADYFRYVNHIDRYGGMDIFTYIGNNSFEIGHYFITKIAYILNNEYVMFFIYALLTAIFGYFAISSKELKSNNSLTWFLFLVLLFPLSFNIMRQALAISIIMYSYKFIINRKIFKFALFVILAFTFHTSAIVFLPCYFLPRIIKNQKQLLITAAIIIVCVLFLANYQSIIANIVNTKFLKDYEYLLDVDSIKKSFNNYQKYISILLLVISMVLYKYLKNKSDFPLLIILILILETTGVMLGDFSPYIKRISLYFTSFYPIIFNQIRMCFDHKNKSRLIITSIILLFAVFYYSYSYIV